MHLHLRPYVSGVSKMWITSSLWSFHPFVLYIVHFYISLKKRHFPHSWETPDAIAISQPLISFATCYCVCLRIFLFFTQSTLTFVLTFACLGKSLEKFHNISLTLTLLWIFCFPERRREILLLKSPSFLCRSKREAENPDLLPAGVV